MGRDILKYPRGNTSLTTKVCAAVVFIKVNDPGEVMGGKMSALR
jgi:hypothetical protein